MYLVEGGGPLDIA